jgi:hypothetical protein
VSDPINPPHYKPRPSLSANAKAMGDTCIYPRNEQDMPGVTLRQWYAGMAMQGLLAGCASNYDAVAEGAVRQADSLLQELAK